MTDVPDLISSLAATDRELRMQFPDTFARVDEIKAQPGWIPFRDREKSIVPQVRQRKPCVRCGADDRNANGKCRPCQDERNHARKEAKKDAQAKS